MEHFLKPVKSLDVRWLGCPYHRLKVSRALEEIKSGEILEVLLEGGEPLSCISQETKKCGNQILGSQKIEEMKEMEELPQNYRLWICKK